MSEFTPKDLVPGLHLIKPRMDNTWMKLCVDEDGNLYGESRSSFTPYEFGFSDTFEDLDTDSKDWDLMEIAVLKKKTGNDTIQTAPKIIIWEREVTPVEPTPVSMKQVNKMFGYPVKIVGCECE